MAAWERPKTTRRYLHPPKAERMFTLWSEGKLILGEIQVADDGSGYGTLECAGLWLLHGDEQFDFRKSVCTITDDGAPVHGLTLCADDLRVELEALCDVDRCPTCFIRLRLTGNTPLRLLVRTGLEHELVFGAPDVYKSYAPDVEVWKTAPKTWRADGNVLTDGRAFVTVHTELSTAWDNTLGALVITPGNQTSDVYLAFGLDGIRACDYDTEKARTQDFWTRELARLRLPEGIANDPERLRMTRHLTAQLLQCFCHPVGREDMLARQGGLQRRIWPWESVSVIEALTRLGDFSDYIEPVLALYFTRMWTPDGEVRPMGIGWACITASAIGSFGTYSLRAGRDFYLKYRDRAYKSFEWVRRKRAESAGIEGCTAGLFPPMRACDWREEFQCWTMTDVYNLEGLRTYVKAAEAYGDPEAPAIRAEYEDYLGVLRDTFRKFSDAESSDALLLPLTPDGDDQAQRDGFYLDIQHGPFVETGAVTERDIERVRNDVVRRGIYKNGLYGHMPYRDGNLHIWYTTFSEYYWFRTFLKLGQRARALEILEALMRYSMTTEYYMLERYADNDPYYVPWSPNASGNGRLLNMLLDYYA
ncbi:MAG: hypothetical protein ACOXZM_01920 [Eubacteriales bacterium]|jgi:hypothetical protein